MADHNPDLSGQKAASRRRQSSDTDLSRGEPSAAESFLRLQSQVGNAHIARLLAQRAGPEEEVQAKRETVGVDGGPVGPDTAGRIESMRGGGSSLDEGTRTSMESAFGTNFDDVRVHTDSESDTLNQRLTARAFTTGSDIFLRRDASPNDTRLLAHELTHVVQQRSMSGSGGGMHVGAAGDSHERHADSVADALTSPSSPASVAAATAQRAGAEEEVQASHDLTQRAAPEDEEVQASHDVAQRADPQEEEVQAAHDVAQRADPQEEEVQASHDAAQREGAAEEEQPA